MAKDEEGGESCEVERRKKNSCKLENLSIEQSTGEETQKGDRQSLAKEKLKGKVLEKDTPRFKDDDPTLVRG